MLRSLYFNEKKATWAPLTINEKNRRDRNITTITGTPGPAANNTGFRKRK
jgi:hypothetical protein